jgi:uncharacterized membrane protein
MIEFPPIPSWDALHPLIIHFPIALLLAVPFLIVAGALRPPERGRTIFYVALALMIAGTLGTFLAVASGEAAGRIAERTPQIDAVLEHHEQLAEAARIAFSVLTVVFAAILLIPVILKKTSNRLVSTVLPLAFLVLYGGGILLLTNTAHNGGRLVHEFGLRAAVKPSSVPAVEREANKTGAADADESQRAGNHD